MADLRERKKAKTRAAIQSEALRLFREKGYGATTVEEIIEAAEVSESTFYRYFPTKADVVLTDDYDPLIVEAFMAQPPGRDCLSAMREAFRSIFSTMSEDEIAESQERFGLILSEPELRSSLLDGLVGTLQMLLEAVAKRSGRPTSDMDVRALTGAVAGAAMVVMLDMVDNPSVNWLESLDQVLAQLEAGFTI